MSERATNAVILRWVEEQQRWTELICPLSRRNRRVGRGKPNADSKRVSS